MSLGSLEETKKFMEAHALIEPPSRSDKDVNKRYYRYIIDSRERNLDYFPHPNKYDLPLSEDVTDVQSVELISFDIPFTKYLISETNNVLEYAIIGDSTRFNTYVGREAYTIIVISPGSYTLEEIVQELNDKNSDTSTTFGVSKQENKVTVMTTLGSGGIIFSEGNTSASSAEKPIRSGGYDHTAPTYYVANLGDRGKTKSPLTKILGLKPSESFVFAGDRVVHPFPYQADLRTDRYISLHLGQTSLNYSENDATNKCFAIIKKDDLESKYMDASYIKQYNPPIPAMRTLRIRFSDYDGNDYDFSNMDHLIELRFCCFKNQRKYNDIF